MGHTDKRVDDLELTTFIRGATRRIHVALTRRGLRDAELEDCAQEVLIDVIERWERLRAYTSAGRTAYVASMCRGAAVSWLRRTRSRHYLFVHEDAELTPDRSQAAAPEREYFGSCVRGTVESCLAGCDPAAKTTFVLVCVAGHTEAEAASLLDVPLGTVASRLRRVRSRLRKELASNELEPGSFAEARAIL
jgi:RNA polymerase sigma-70 factor, ECF subfamily